MFTHRSTHLNFSWPEIKSTRVNLKYLISNHSKSIRTQNFLVQKRKRHTETATDDTRGRKKSDTLKYITTPTLGLKKKTHTSIHGNTPLYTAKIYEHYYLCIRYLSNFDKVKLFVFNILVFINFLSSTFICINCVVYCGTGTLIYILEKYHSSTMGSGLKIKMSSIQA